MDMGILSVLWANAYVEQLYIGSFQQFHFQKLIYCLLDLAESMMMRIGGLWLVQSDHVTWILASDWLGLIIRRWRWLMLASKQKTGPLLSLDPGQLYFSQFILPTKYFKTWKKCLFQASLIEKIRLEFKYHMSNVFIIELRDSKQPNDCFSSQC